MKESMVRLPSTPHLRHPFRYTRLLRVSPGAAAHPSVAEAAAFLRAGGLVAFPTETVYGLGAHALLTEAVASVFHAKGRPADNPLIVHVASVEAARELAAEWNSLAQAAAEAFWPGPLTLVVPAAAGVPPVVTAGLPTVAVRFPDHPVASALIATAKVPVVAPSANRSGRPSPTSARHVWDDLRGRVDLVLDGGSAGIGLESTVLDVSVRPPAVLRPGGVSVEALRAVLGRVEVSPSALEPWTPDQSPAGVASPGVKYRHYAPRCPALVVEGEPDGRRERLAALAEQYRGRGQRVGVIATEEGARALEQRLRGARSGSGARGGDGEGDVLVRVTGPLAHPEGYAARLFDYLRDLERRGCDVIIMEGIEPTGIGLAVMNRLRKAAGFRIVRAGEGDERPLP